MILLEEGAPAAWLGSSRWRCVLRRASAWNSQRAARRRSRLGLRERNLLEGAVEADAEE
jgi:hypothetical protein